MFKPISLLTVLIAHPLLAWAQTPSPSPSPLALPVIQINSSDSKPLTTSNNQKIELPPIEGQGPKKVTLQGRRFWGTPYGAPAGPGRAWPDAAPPGNSGPAGGLLSPGLPGRPY